MSESEIKVNSIDARQFADVVEMIRSTRSQVLRMATAALIDLYWQVGQYLSVKIASAEWGDGVVKQLAAHIEKNAHTSKILQQKAGRCHVIYYIWRHLRWYRYIVEFL